MGCELFLCSSCQLIPEPFFFFRNFLWNTYTEFYEHVTLLACESPMIHLRKSSSRYFEDIVNLSTFWYLHRNFSFWMLHMYLSTKHKIVDRNIGIDDEFIALTLPYIRALYCYLNIEISCWSTIAPSMSFTSKLDILT